jgi:hypothetical protein
MLSEANSLSPESDRHLLGENLRCVKLFGSIVVIILLVGATNDITNPPYRKLLP